MTATLPPGPELDVAVHAALGRTLAANKYGVWPMLPAYSTDANAALEAYEEMRKLGWRIFTIADILSPAEEWRISLKRYVNTERQAVQSEGPSFASALCAAIVEAGRQ